MPVLARKSQPAVSPAVVTSWRSILDSIPAGAYTCDAAGLITYFNPLAEAVWGRAPKLRDPADRYCGSFKLYSSNGALIRHDECWMALALQKGKKYNGREIVIEQPGGGRILAMAYANPLRDNQGQIIGAVNLVIDITAQKKLEADRRKTRSIVTKYHDATLAIIEVGVAALTSATWATSAFS
jgi:two-component system sensor kinase FixL